MNILLVRLRLIGDVVFTTPAIRAIRRRYPDARIAYVVEEEAAPVVRGNPHVDEVIVAVSPRASGRLASDLSLVRRLRRERYDLAIDFHGGPRSSLLTWASGAPVRIGFDVVGRSWMYTTHVARPRALRPRHSVDTQWDLLRPLDIAPPDPGADPVKDARTIAAELKKFAGDLAAKERWLLINKIDLLEPAEVERRAKDIVRRLRWKGPVLRISGATGAGTAELKQAVMSYLEAHPRVPAAQAEVAVAE